MYTTEEVDTLLGKTLEDFTKAEVDRIIEIFLEATDTDEVTFNRISHWLNHIVKEARP